MKKAMKLSIVNEDEFRVLRFVEAEETAMAAKALLEPLFASEADICTSTLLGASTGAMSSLLDAAEDEGFNPRDFWRCFTHLTLAELEAFFLARWRALFWLAWENLGLKNDKFDVLIDEHQTIFFGRPRTTKKDAEDMEFWEVEGADAGLTEIGQLVERRRRTSTAEPTVRWSSNSWWPASRRAASCCHWTFSSYQRAAQ